MAKKDESKTQSNKSEGISESFKSLFAKERKRIDLSAKAVIDNIVFSKSDATAYYKVTPSLFSFLSRDAQVSNARAMATGFSSLVENRTEPLELHTITTSEPLDVDAWHAQVSSITASWDPSREFSAFLNQMADYVEMQQFSNRVAYLGINLGKRGAINFSNMNPLEAGFKGALETGKNWLSNSLKTFDEDISAAEEHEFRQKEQHFFTTLRSAGLSKERVSAQELLLLIKRQLYPTMPAPFLDIDHENRIGAGDIALETSSVILNKYRHLEISQMMNGTELVGYRSVISLSRFPRDSMYPYTNLPFFTIPETLLGIPFTTFSRFRLIPNAKMRKLVEDRRKIEMDQIKNQNASGQSAATAAVADNTAQANSLRDLGDMDALTNNDKMPWVEGSYRVVIEAVSEKALRELTAAVKQKYSEQGITTQLSAGDQLELFLEQMPGDKTRINSFKQLTNINQIPASGFNIASSVGDPIWGGSPTGRA